MNTKDFNIGDTVICNKNKYFPEQTKIIVIDDISNTPEGKKIHGKTSNNKGYLYNENFCEKYSEPKKIIESKWNFKIGDNIRYIDSNLPDDIKIFKINDIIEKENGKIFLQGITKSGKIVLYDEDACEKYIENIKKNKNLGKFHINSIVKYINEDNILDEFRIFKIIDILKNINNEIFLKGITKSGKFVLYDEKYCEEFIEKSQMGIKIGDMVICNNDKIPEVDRIFSVDKMSRSFDGDINLHGISKSGKPVS